MQQGFWQVGLVVPQGKYECRDFMDIHHTEVVIDYV